MGNAAMILGLTTLTRFFYFSPPYPVSISIFPTTPNSIPTSREANRAF